MEISPTHDIWIYWAMATWHGNTFVRGKNLDIFINVVLDKMLNTLLSYL